MQETLIDTKTYDDPKSTIDKFEKASVKKHDTQHHPIKSSNTTSSSVTVVADGDLSITSQQSKKTAMGEILLQDIQINNEKRKKEKEQNKLLTNTSNNEELSKDDDNKEIIPVITGKDNIVGIEIETTEKNGEIEKKTKKIIESSSLHDNISGVNIEKDKVSSGEKKNGKSTVAAALPPPPVMRGTLSLDLNSNRHLIRGMWNYENSTTFPPQRFELVRNLEPDEDKKTLPIDGVFHGTFSLAYFHTTSKGKQKERSKVIPENGVDIKFTPIPEKEGHYNVDGKGTNQFGIFHINGTAEPSEIADDPTLSIVLKKRYEPGEVAVVVEPVIEEAASSNQLIKTTGVIASTTIAGTDQDNTTGPLPEPTKSFASGVVCLRGNLYKEDASELGLNEVVHRINGMWASGLDIILADPQNVQGLCNRFEYEHKSSTTSLQFPVSGRYSGWFELSNEDLTRTRINERDVSLKFRLNNAGYHNIEGKGSNVFGRYTITGTLTLDNVITIFRQFQPRKIKTKQASAAPNEALEGTVAPEPARLTSFTTATEGKLKLEDVVISAVDPNDSSGITKEPYNPISPPTTGMYSAVSQGVLRVNEDGSHTCQGKWAVTREHFTNSLTSNFNFRLEPHHAQDAMKFERENNEANDEERQFPLDCTMYKGSFQMKKQGTRYQTVVDQQMVMKFRKNTQGSYNVYGTGINTIGEFNLLGTLVMSGKAGGQVELYRIYKPNNLANPAAINSVDDEDKFATFDSAPLKVESTTSIAALQSGNSTAHLERSTLLRRESSRMSKLPSRLEEDDPNAQLSRIMEKCIQVLKFIREKDIELGAFFSEPVDPVALGIPTYHQVIKEPMDLRTVQRKMDSSEVTTPEEFMRLVRLVFENAMTFNIDPTHSVHQASRTLLVRFNEKIRDVERLVSSIRRTHGLDEDGKGKKKSKDEKKRKRQAEEPKSLRRQRLDEVQTMVESNSSAFANLIAAAPGSATANVTRVEFNLLVNLLQQFQSQLVQTHTALADLSPGDQDELNHSNTTSGQQNTSALAPKNSQGAASKALRAPSPDATQLMDKKVMKRKMEMTKEPESVVNEDDASPLSHEEQEWLTETISELPSEHLGGVIQIIREAGPFAADEDEIDIEIDLLDHKTQRKLMKHVLKFVKKSKPKPKKKLKPQQQLQKMVSEKPPPAKKLKPGPKPKPLATTESFFSFGGNDGSDSDSSSSGDEEEKSGGEENKDAANEFNLSTGIDDLHHDENDDDDDLESDGIAGNWNISNPTNQSDKKEDDEDLDWAAAAREQAAEAKKRDADRKAREEKKKKEAEEANKKAMAEAAKRKEELLAKQAEKKEKEASLLEQQEKEAEKAREAAREKARAEAQSVEQTVDLDAQRELMKQFDPSFLDNESMGGASPSSDFGF